MLKHSKQAQNSPQNSSMGRFLTKKATSREALESPLSPPTRDSDYTYRRAPSAVSSPGVEERGVDVDVPGKRSVDTAETQVGQSREMELRRLRAALAEAHRGNAKLRESTNTLLQENLKLKDTLEEAGETAKGTPEYEELGQLLQMVMGENRTLVAHLAAERRNWLDIKALHSLELEKLQDQVGKARTQLAHTRQDLGASEAQYQSATARVTVMEDELSSVIPLSRHKAAMERAEGLLGDLRRSYAEELGGLKAELAEASAERRRVGRAAAEAEARLDAALRSSEEAERRLGEAEAQVAHLQASRAQLGREKAAAEEELSKLLATLKRRSPAPKGT